MLLASHAAESLGIQTPIGQKSVELYSEMIDADTSASPASPTEGRSRGDRDFSVVYDYLKELSETKK